MKMLLSEAAESQQHGLAFCAVKTALLRPLSRPSCWKPGSARARLAGGFFPCTVTAWASPISLTASPFPLQLHLAQNKACAQADTTASFCFLPPGGGSPLPAADVPDVPSVGVWHWGQPARPLSSHVSSQLKNH